MFSQPEDQKLACKWLHELRSNGSDCKPILDYQFESVNIQVIVDILLQLENGCIGNFVKWTRELYET